MKKISKQKIILIFSIITFLASCGIFITLVLSISSKNEKTKEEHLKYLEEVALQDKIVSLKDVVDKTSSERESLDNLFLQESNTVEFLTYLESLFQVASVKGEISNVSKINIQKNINTPTLEISIDVEGNFNQIYNYLNLLENIPYEYTMIRSDLGLQNTPDIAGFWKLAVTLQIKSMKI